MKNDAPFGALALSSLRLSTGFLLVFGLALLLALTSFWALLRLLDDHEAKVDLHFLRVMENIQEQENFLSIVSDKLRHPTVDLALAPDALAQKWLLRSDGMDIYQASERSFSLPFTLAQNAPVDGQRLDLLFGMGWHLTNLFSRFWAGSHYQSPQVLMFSPNSSLKVAVPGIGELRDQNLLNLGNYIQVTESAFTQVNTDPVALQDDKAHWVSFAPVGQMTESFRMLAYVGATIPLLRFQQESGLQKVIVASVFDMHSLKKEEREADQQLFDHLSLVGPDGAVLMGRPEVQGAPYPGLSLSRVGLLVTKQSSTAGGGQWTAHYLLGYANFFRWATWPLLRLLAALITVSAASGWLYHLYRTRVVTPAKLAQQQLIESRAFSQAVIDAAPAGLSVIRLRDNRVVLENQRAQSKRTVSEAIAQLLQRPDIALSGEACMAVGERYYFVSYTESRYQDEDVSLCVFNDVTEHKRNFAELRDAKLNADRASDAKTVFLATMSHEIRTPLYGVLGTLELLGLTHLDQRQRDYLQVIQRSSSTLLQLISDVLDVSKIEAGQLALEATNFCPLDLAEDALSAHVANAGAKGLQIYACIDADVPDLLFGDQMRIWQILNNLLSNAIKFTDIGRIVLRGRVLKDDPDQVLLEYQVTDTGIGISQEQQLHLFDPFYQARSNNLVSGTGLGLSICTRFSELMGGEIRVVSEPGLGSSFSLVLPLRKVNGTMPDIADIELDNIAVYVYAPVRELADNISNWLNRWGANSRVVSATAQEKFAEALLVEVLGSAQRPLDWSGERLICDADGPLLPEFRETGWRVGAHHVRAIARGVLQTQQALPTALSLVEGESAPRLELRVLVAEDNPINQGILKEQLEALGCSVTLAGDGQQAMQVWEPGLFDAVLTDVNMPLMNGYQLAEAVRKTDSEIPIIGVTANAMREEGERCRASGMTSWIVKPLSLSTLRSQLLKATPLVVPSVLARRPVTMHYTPEPIVLSAGMRDLFLLTMNQDSIATRNALAVHDQKIVREKLHGLCGALAVVQATELSGICGRLEHRIVDQELDATLVVDIDQALKWLATLLASVETSVLHG